MAAAEKKARDLSARAKKGEKFPELARSELRFRHQGETTVSSAASSAANSTRQIEDIVFAAERGSVTDPIRVPTAS